MRCTSQGDGSSTPFLQDPSEVPSSSSSLGGNDSHEKIPDSKWWAGLMIYAATNCGFLKLFDICSKITDISTVLMFMAIYYAIAFVLRLVLRNVLELGKEHVPQFFWEPPFYPRRTLDK